MKIAVIGSREFTDEKFVYSTIHDYLDITPILISGGARGVDSWAENYYKTNFIHHPTKIFKAKWDDLSHLDAIIKTNKFGKKYDARAGMRRNKLIINEADKVVAFWDGKSTGTKNSIDLAIKAKKPMDIYVRS